MNTKDGRGSAQKGNTPVWPFPTDLFARFAGIATPQEEELYGV